LITPSISNGLFMVRTDPSRNGTNAFAAIICGSRALSLRANVPLKSSAQIGTQVKDIFRRRFVSTRRIAADLAQVGASERRSESDAGGYKQRVVVAGCCTKGAGLVAHRSNSGCCAAHIRFGRPNLRPNGVAASPLQAASFHEAAIFEFKPDSWAPSVTRVIDEPSKGFGPLDSSFAPGSQEV
jgi:hypothetical protein